MHVVLCGLKKEDLPKFVFSRVTVFRRYRKLVCSTKTEKKSTLYRMIQEERSIFWRDIISVIVSK
jgi:hypothetical protein